MKKIFSIIIFMLLLSSAAFAGDFCNGFKQGYKTGFKQAKGSSMNPMTPMCPMKPMKKMSDPKSDYEFGYTIGYRKGLRS